ncbi:MAG TPA: SCO family protein [Steroidobacteraceae bacterium]|nr:SCO family protein [Steroidobacteraceae bacterium]
MDRRVKMLSLALLLLAGISGVAASMLWRHSRGSQVELATGTYLSSPRSLPNFSLIDQHGAPFAPRNLEGHWSILFFGYTNCPDFCPTTLALLSSLDKRLRAERAPVRPEVIFLSVDARRDTPAQLERYVPYFDPDFLGVTAKDQATIEDLARHLGVAVILEPPRADGSYSVDHSGSLFVLDPRGRIQAILTGPFTVASLETDLERIVAARS